MSFKRILLVKPSGRKGLSFAFDLVPIGLEYLAAYIEDAVDKINIVDLEMNRRKFQTILDLYQPDLVGISLSATEHNESLQLAKIAKKSGAITVVGGYHPTSVPDLMLSYPQIDIVVRGEGELTLRELIETGTTQNLLGASYKNNGEIIHNQDRPRIKNLDLLPFPARHLRQYSYQSQNRTDNDVISMSRGCNGLCSFCCEPSMSNGCLSCRSPENVMQEILKIVEYHKNRPLSIMFTDPNLMSNPKGVELLCDLLIEKDLNIEFSALVRADAMAKYSDIVKKMCQAGITKFEMGIESPHLKDLKSTKKGITNKVHSEAVNNIRKHGGRPGGTFVIGLPDQTTEEIKAFPTYAREIGLTAAAFGIATPFPGTDFYKEMEQQGLIFETNWDNFDEMHSVYTTKYMPKETVEEMATYCMAKFWNLDTFIDQELVSQKRTLTKKNIIDFARERTLNVGFLANNGTELQKDNFGQHIKTFLEAYVDPRVETFTKTVGVHEVLELRRFLRILGHQKIQCTLNLDDIAVSFVFKTTKNTVDYIQVMYGKQPDSTIHLNADLKWLSEPSNSNLTEKLGFAFSQNLSPKKLWNTFRLLVAVSTEFLAWTIQKQRIKK